MTSEPIQKIGATYPFWKARTIMAPRDQGGTGIAGIDHQHAMAEAGKILGRGQSPGPASDDQHIFGLGVRVTGVAVMPGGELSGLFVDRT